MRVSSVLRKCIYVFLSVLLRALFLVLFCPVLIIVVIVDIPYSDCIIAILIFFIVSFAGPVTRSRSLATAHSELNNKSKEVVCQSRMSFTAMSGCSLKLSELLKAVEKSITTSEQNKDTLTNAHELAIRKQTDLLKSQQRQQAQIATLISQSALQTGPAVHPTSFYGKTTDDLFKSF